MGGSLPPMVRMKLLEHFVLVGAPDAILADPALEGFRVDVPELGFSVGGADQQAERRERLTAQAAGQAQRAGLQAHISASPATRL